MNTKQLDILRTTLTANDIQGVLKHAKTYSPTAIILAIDNQKTEILEYSIEHNSSGAIYRVYFGIVGLGIIANYDVLNGQWYRCYSHGNCGQNWSSGGTWTGEKTPTTPELLTKLIKRGAK